MAKEIIKTNRSLLFSLWLIKVFPEWLICIFIFPISVFFYIFAREGRIEIRRFQKQLVKYTKTTGKKCPIKKAGFFSGWKTVMSFSYSLVEKFEGWQGKLNYERISTFDDDLNELVENLNSGKGAFIIGSHLGNIEMLRSLSSFNENACKKEISILIMMDLKSTAVFNDTLSKINSQFAVNVIDISEISPETIIRIETHIDNGGLVVIAADRLGKFSAKSLTVDFLGKKAHLPYGVFLIPALIKKPVYYLFGLRSKTPTLRPHYNMYIEKSSVDFNGEASRKERENQISRLSLEFSQKLEKFSILYPEQWYNFFNFWPEESV